MEKDIKKKTKNGSLVLGAIILALIVLLDSLLIFNEESAPPANASASSSSFIGSSSSSSDGVASDSSSGGGGGGGGGAFWFRILTDYTGLIYLREDAKSFYTGNGEHGFTGDRKYYLESKNDINPSYYFGYACAASGMQYSTGLIELGLVKNELLPYMPYVKTETEEENIYEMQYFAYDYFLMGLDGIRSFASISPSYATQELRYRNFVKNTYLDIDDSLKDLLLQLASENGIEASSSTVVLDVANYIQNAAYYDIGFSKKNYPDDKDMVTYFLTEFQRGVCRHFAASATMMYRALGVPARYAIGFAVYVESGVLYEHVDAGHAWTEIYIDGYGWVPIEVTGSRMYPGEDL